MVSSDIKAFVMGSKRRKIKDIGPITFGLYHIFRALNWISPSHYILNNRGDIHKQMKNLPEDILYRKTRKRAKSVDIYLLTFMSIELLLIFLSPQLVDLDSKWINYAILIFLVIRLIEIVQINVNLALFDALKVKELRIDSPHSMASPTRTVINMTMNYLELFAIFGLLYFLAPGGTLTQGNASISYIDNFYYSVVVQMTNGFENTYPTGWYKPLTIIQMSVGTMFIVLIIARVINLLPTIRSVVEKNETN